MRLFASVFFLVSLMASLATPARGTDSNLKSALLTKYQHQTALHAEITQIKKASYLLEPLQTKVILDRDKTGAITWHVVSPYESKVVIADGKVKGLGADEKKMPPQFSTAIGIISSIVGAQIDKLESDFTVEFDPAHKSVKATPHELTRRSFPYTVSITFHDSLAPATVHLAAEDETIELLFNSFTIKE